MRTGESELLGLRWDWIDFNDGVIRLPATKTLKDSTGEGQVIVMQKELTAFLKSLPAKSEWVFCRPDGTPLRHWDFYRPFKKILRTIGIDPSEYSCKEIRHSTGTVMHRKGVPLTAIKDQLRHTSSKTTENFYIGSDLDYQREMAERLVINSGKIVGKDEIRNPSQLPTA